MPAANCRNAVCDGRHLGIRGIQTRRLQVNPDDGLAADRSRFDVLDVIDGRGQDSSNGPVSRPSNSSDSCR